MKTKQNPLPAGALNFALNIYKCASLKRSAIAMIILCLGQVLCLPGSANAQSSSPASTWTTLTVTLYGYNPDGSKYVADGVRVNYADQFSNYVDDNDADKLFGSSPSLAINRNDTMLVIERRHTIIKNDTIPLSLKGASVSNYMFEFGASYFQPGLVASVHDSYLNSSFIIDLQQVTDIAFTITADPASRLSNRFSVGIVPTSVLPVTFNFFNAIPNGKNINITWGVNGGDNIKQYIVQHSGDGINFSNYSSENAAPGNAISKMYKATFTGATAGNHFFRIESIDNDNKVSFTQIISVSVAGSAKAGIYCVATDNNNIRLAYNNMQSGNYKVELVSAGGQILYSQQQNLREANGNINIHTQSSVGHGLYYITLRSATGVQSAALVF